MNSHGFPDDQSILDQFSDLLTCVCIGNLIGLVGVQPHLLLAAAQDAGQKSSSFIGGNKLSNNLSLCCVCFHSICGHFVSFRSFAFVSIVF
uniref:Uncharacterized protein n=1 Tax=Salarias fasciatus TaxID=181472 RepID=A0A672FPL0_SALFA